MRENRDVLTDPLALSLLRPEWSARTPLTRSQRLFFLLGLLVFVAVAAWRPWAAAMIFVAVSTVFYLVVTIYKFVLVRFSVAAMSEIHVTAEEADSLRPEDLPVYSILVPMYKEADSLPRVVAAVMALDYPEEKKDIQLLLEEDDQETRQAAEAMRLPPSVRITLVPPSFPRTKPKACNVGLAKARGEYLVIYDAEDRPERDQLRKAVAAFRRVGPEVICLQCRLNFYNPNQNILTRWFAAEYSAWFDLSLPGLCALGAVIPLGGTSNHFVTARLRELMGWDAYNVTEDCDLGVRIYRAGYSSRMLNTTTWEEACADLGYWIRQRTRWLKGYIQTYLVHMRKPLLLMRELGVANFLHFQLLIGGIVFSFLINPVFWFLTLLWFFFRLQSLSALFPGLIFASGALCLFAGNFGFVYVGMIACFRRGYYDLVKYALAAPVYWMLMSYSGWRAFVKFLADPFHWEKTRHGFWKVD